MNKQSETIREITFAERDTLILVPPKMLEQVISCCQKGPRLRIALDEFYPPDLVEYLRQVLETNRHLSLDSLRSLSGTSRLPLGCACEGMPGMDEIFMLSMIQLGGLQIDQRLWFSRLEYTQTTARENLLLTEYTTEAQEIGRPGGIFLHGNSGYKKGRTACILAPAL